MRIYLQRHTQQLRNLKLQHVIEAQPAEQMETDSRPAPSSSWGEKKRGGVYWYSKCLLWDLRHF